MIMKCRICGCEEFEIDKQNLGYMVISCKSCLHDAIIFEGGECLINLEGFKTSSTLNGFETSPAFAAQ